MLQRYGYLKKNILLKATSTISQMSQDSYSVRSGLGNSLDGLANIGGFDS